ncbi:putative baseplate assembly protein [Nonomuraea sp. NPDC049714]|uniref:putative baseplate assembly protein n=1 Tax=Nonomuraea sp. NPDC049714 TaxID=3364357 RepID=UPI00378EECED
MMSLPAPRLDDRHFQDLVDEAKKLIQQRCPEWTDHNVSDPGITLVETFAFMVDQLIYRLNRVTDLHYMRFLDLLGVRLFPPTPAACDLTFTLAASRAQPVTVPKATRVANVHVEGEEPVVFMTTRDLVIVPSALDHLCTGTAGSQQVDRGVELREGTGVDCFTDPPRQNDAVYFGLPNAVPRCVVLLSFDCAVAGAGIDPDDPPLEWQYWKGDRWAACELESDTTGGLTRDGEVLLHVPDDHVASVVADNLGGWLRCRVVEARQGEPYSSTPRIMAVTARTMGGSVEACHADLVKDEILGTAEGVPGQRFTVRRPPIVVTDEKLVVQVLARNGPQEWTEVDSFASTSASSRHFVVDRVAGEIVFPPAVREKGGSMNPYGDVPEKGALVKMPAYLTGGGRRGNVAREALVVPRDPVPFVRKVINRRPAVGGVDAESVADAAVRGPLQLRGMDRAVTVEDYEALARTAASNAARIKCVPVTGSDGGPTEGVRVLVVPDVRGTERNFEQFMPKEEMVRAIATYLDERRCLGARILVEPPSYQGVTVVAELRAGSAVNHEEVRARALSALYTYLNPVTGGQWGTGWPFGRPVQAGEVHAILQQVEGVDLIDEILLFEADPVTGRRGDPVQQITLKPDTLVFSYGHQIKVES